MAQSNPRLWKPEHLAFQHWLALPPAARVPEQQKEFAALLGVREATLSSWKRLNGFMDDVNTLAMELVRDDVADVLGTIRRKAKQGDIAFVNLFLSMAGLSGPVADANPHGIMFIEAIRPDGV